MNAYLSAHSIRFVPRTFRTCSTIHIQVRETYEERHKAQTVSEMADFMKKFKHSQQEHSLLHVHINLAEKVAEETRSGMRISRRWWVVGVCAEEG